MPLAGGDKLGPYEIVEAIGKGGMGEVWRAHDPRMGRDVAIKVSAEQFSERFSREVRVVAALNHPNICHLYDVGPNFLVMELIEGPTLADRIQQGAIPFEESLGMARQIADALEAAHEKGIVHRDLKPGNVKVKPDGTVKVLDFGLAKMGTPAEASGSVDPENSPTITMAATQAGVILGTAAYMAPEQARGKPVDKRADIWAFGVVLYEVLTGKQPFSGETVGDILAGVLKEQPDLSAVPIQVRRLIGRCLEKDPKKRLRDISVAWELLESGAEAPEQAKARPTWWVVGSGVSLLLAASFGFLYFRKAPPAAPVVTRFEYPLPEGQNFTRTGRHDLAISPDGTKLAYVANQQLYLRAMDQLEALPVRGTDEDPMEPVFSPDSQWLAYFVPAEGAGVSTGGWVLKKIAVTGGAPVTLGQLPGAPFGATWSDGMIAFGVNTGGTAGIQAIPDSGGTLQALVSGDPKKERIMQPQLLADGKHVLFVSSTIGTGESEGQIVAGTLGGKERKILIPGGSDPRVLPTGQLVYIHAGTLLAVPFDIRGLRVTGGPVPFVEGIAETPNTWAGQFALSSSGTLAFSSGAAGSAAQFAMVWVDRQGHEEPIPAPLRAYRYPRLSPDDARIAVSSQDEEKDVWVFDLAKGTLTRLTFGSSGIFEVHPIWMPDNKSLLFSLGWSFSAVTTAPADVFRKSADGTGATEALTEHLQGGYPMSVAPDGKTLVFRKFGPASGLFLLPLEPRGEAHPLIPKSTVYDGEISPDGRWIAYDSTESGRREVYVRPFPAVDSGRWQISAEGGAHPLWARSGRELFFVTPANRMVTVPIQPGATFAYGKPEPLFDASAYYTVADFRMFDISADGKRFLMVKEATSGKTKPSIVVVSHWSDEVNRRVPSGGR